MSYQLLYRSKKLKLKEEIKTESTRKWRNFNSQGTKTLYQNNLKNITFFSTFLRAKDVISICYSIICSDIWHKYHE